MPELHRKIVGEVSGSMFGSAIISVGDLNGEEKDGKIFYIILG